jgi:hypothetical protein
MDNDELTPEEARSALGHVECSKCREELCANPNPDGCWAHCDRELAVFVGPDRLPYCSRCDGEVNGVEGEGVAA